MERIAVGQRAHPLIKSQSTEGAVLHTPQCTDPSSRSPPVEGCAGFHIRDHPRNVVNAAQRQGPNHFSSVEGAGCEKWTLQCSRQGRRARRKLKAGREWLAGTVAKSLEDRLLVLNHAPIVKPVWGASPEQSLASWKQAGSCPAAAPMIEGFFHLLGTAALLQLNRWPVSCASLLMTIGSGVGCACSVAACHSAADVHPQPPQHPVPNTRGLWGETRTHT